MGIVSNELGYSEKYYAKGVGDAFNPLPLVGALKIEAGTVYNTYTGYNAIILTKMTSVSINKSVKALLPERTAISVTDGLELVFDRSQVVLTAQFT